MAGKWVSSGSLANVWVIPAAAAAGLDADTLAWVAAVVSNGGSVSAARQIIMNDLIVGLKADGVWTNLDRLWLFAAEDQPSALTDVVGLALATAVNSPAFAVDEGYTGDGATALIDTNFDPTSGSPNLVRDSACMFVWDNTGGSGGGVCYQGSNSLINPDFGGNYYMSLNCSVTGIAGAPGTTGLFLVNRAVSTEINKDYNGTLLSDETVASSPISSADFLVLRDSGGFSSRQICCFGVGGSLDGTERVAIYDRLRAYMTAVGVP